MVGQDVTHFVRSISVPPRRHGLGIFEPVRARFPALFRTRSLRFDSTFAKGKEDSRSFDASSSCRSLDIDYLGALELGANDRSAGLFDCPSKSGDRKCRGRMQSADRCGARSVQRDHFTPLSRTPFHVRFSNWPVRVKRFQAVHDWRCRCHSRARASLRNRRHGPSIMGFEDKVERS